MDTIALEYGDLEVSAEGTPAILVGIGVLVLLVGFALIL